MYLRGRSYCYTIWIKRIIIIFGIKYIYIVCYSDLQEMNHKCHSLPILSYTKHLSRSKYRYLYKAKFHLFIELLTTDFSEDNPNDFNPILTELNILVNSFINIGTLDYYSKDHEFLLAIVISALYYIMEFTFV